MTQKTSTLLLILLTLLGSVNWGLVGLLNFNLIQTVIPIEFLERVVYIAIGISGIVFLIRMGKGTSHS